MFFIVVTILTGPLLKKGAQILNETARFNKIYFINNTLAVP